MLFQPFQRCRLLFILSIATFCGPVYSYVDTLGNDYIVDAPWRTIREYVPVLFFAPDNKNSVIAKLELRMFDPSSNSIGDLIYLDDTRGSDKTTCSGSGGTHKIEILDHDGFIGTPFQVVM